MKKREIKIIGIRPGEKLHEQMISKEDSMYTLEFDEYFKIYPAIGENFKLISQNSKGTKLDSGFEYKSNSNDSIMKIDELKKWINANINSIGKI